ncbi:MafB-related protein [Thioploca ingrica]|uniref:MafB-related protein n=1 Tax=Thioploca ingrica TaxID=40754 RepID=A0A090BVF8_9GAMM|nr:MafB-related protein [Thioploca ingrica]
MGIFSSGKKGTRVTRDYSKKLANKERKLILQNRKKSGKQHGQAGKPYEEVVREKTFVKSEVINGREIDSFTNDALIQAKDSESAVNKPHNFLNKKTRTQIKETVVFLK